MLENLPFLQRTSRDFWAKTRKNSAGWSIFAHSILSFSNILFTTIRVETSTESCTMSDSVPAPLDTEIEARFRQAGLIVPPDLKAGALGEARAALSVTFWLRQPRTAAAEPSNIFSLAKGE
jgi:hypothetical protein